MKDRNIYFYFRHLRKKDWSYFYIYLIPTLLLWKSKNSNDNTERNYFGVTLRWLTFEIELLLLKQAEIDITSKIDYSKNTQLHVMVQNRPKDWRLGQAYYNYAYQLYPKEAVSLIGAECDCFNNDMKIPAFLRELNKNLLTL